MKREEPGRGFVLEATWRRCFGAMGPAAELKVAGGRGQVRTEHYRVLEAEEAGCLLRSQPKCHFICRLPLTMVGWVPFLFFFFSFFLNCVW